MKKVSVTLTYRSVTCLVFDKNTEELSEQKRTFIGENFDGVERDFCGDNFTVLKIREVGEKHTDTFSMPVSDYLRYGIESENYKFGYINRKFGGEVATVKLFDNESEEIVTDKFTDMNDNEIRKALKGTRFTYLKTVSREKTNEFYVYMSQLTFMAHAEKENK